MKFILIAFCALLISTKLYAQETASKPDQPTAQTLYAGCFAGTGIYKIAPDGTSTLFAKGAGGGLAFDKNGNLYNAHGGRVMKFTPDGKSSLFADGFKNAFGLAIDTFDNVYVGEHGVPGAGITKFTPDGKRIKLDIGNTAGYGLSSDSNGNIYYQQLTGHIWKYTQNGERIDMGQGAGWGRTAIIDAHGDFYSIGYNVIKVSKGQIVGMFAPGVDFIHTVGLAMDASGHLYSSNCSPIPKGGQGTVYKYDHNGHRTVFSHPGRSPFYIAFYPPSVLPSETKAAVPVKARSLTSNASPPSPAPGAPVNAKDGAEMVLVPVGEFTMGTDPLPDSEGYISNFTLHKENVGHVIVNAPKHKVTLDGYLIYKYDVTVAQYRKFCTETGREMPPAPSWGWVDNHPIVNVNWEDADKYAKWAGASLPTEAQWEKAARGTDGRAFPWGDNWDAKRCVHSDTIWGDQQTTEPVGSHPEGASPYGAMDMAGNVWNWCSDWFHDDYYQSSPANNPEDKTKTALRVVRGGAWCLCEPKAFRSTNRDWASYPGHKGNDVGFRCVVAIAANTLAPDPAAVEKPMGFFITVGGINGEVDGEKAEGQFGVIYKTTDLVTWEERFKGGPIKEKFNHAVNNGLRCMAYGNGTFVAIGNPKCVIVSKDGSTWEEVETPHGAFCIAFGDGKFLAGTASNLMTSTNGREWTTSRMDPSIPVWGADSAGHIRNIVYGNGAFLVYGEQRIGVTKDCKTFVAHKIIKEPSHRKSVVAFGAGKFVWLNPETGHQISADGVAWQPLVIDDATQKDQTELLWTGDCFLVKAGRLLFSSVDGETWEKTETNVGFRLTAYGNGKLVSFHGWDSTYRVSTDQGKTWGALLKPDVKVSARCLYFFDGKQIIGLGGG